ncbi:chaplin family protein [Streptomyces sp. NPDC093085]|uniref:chaplin n=1 Tax=Streptomyces sp. NPDC093085 TaxID=3155068 RepID=UPI003441C937
MRQVTRKGLITVAAAGGVLALGGGYAHADAGAGATAANSPGVLSGNNVQVPVHVPVNVCGNTVDVVGVLNPAFGNKCGNFSGKPSGGHGSGGGYGDDGGGYGGGAHAGGGSHQGGSHPGGHPGSSGGGSHTGGGAVDSPGVGSGNSVEVPIDVPVNVCGNSVDLVGLLNPTFGNHCETGEHPAPPAPGPEHPGEPAKPPVTPVTPATPGPPTETRTITTPESPREQAPVARPAAVTQPRGTDVLASTGAGDLIGIGLPAGAGLLLAGTVLYRRARA